MQERQARKVSVEEIASIVDAMDEVVRAAVKAASARTDGGKNIDSWQVHSERVAYAATECLAARALLDYAREAEASGTDAALVVDEAAVYAGETAARLCGQFVQAGSDFALPQGLFERTLGSAAIRERIEECASENRIRSIGRAVAAQ